MKFLRELLEEYIFEAPQRIPALKLKQLEDPKQNKKLCKQISKWTPTAKVLETTSTGIKLYQQSKCSEHEIYAIDEDEGRITYYVRYEVQKADFIDVDWATQVLVWKSSITSVKTKGLPETVFFKYVLPLNDVVVSDGEQSADGERFWKYRIADAFANTKYKVYLVDFHNKKVTRFKTRDDYEKLLNTKNDPWGSTAWHKGIRLAIAEFDLIQE